MSGSGRSSVIARVAKTELASLFGSPIAWFILVIFSVLTAVDFTKLVEACAASYSATEASMSLTKIIFLGGEGFFQSIASKLFIYIPLLTMGLISRELSSGSIKLVWSSPVTATQFVLGKYLAALVVALCLMIIPLLASVAGWLTIADFDPAPVLVALLGLFLLICAYSAIGLLMSSLTSYQVVAAVATLAVLALLGQIGNFGREYEVVRNVTYWLSMGGRASSFLSGVLRSDDLIYFVDITLLFVVLTVFRVSFPRLGVARWKKFSGYVVLAAVVFALAFVSSRPDALLYCDATRNKSNSITEESKAIVARIPGKVTVNSYVNLLDPLSFSYLPTRFAPSKGIFEQYKLAKPELAEHVIYYYAPTASVMENQRFEGKTLEEVRDYYLMVYNLNPSVFRSYEELQDVQAIRDEDYVFVREILTEDGRSVLLRNFRDAYQAPSEAEISAAFAKLYARMPAVAFLCANGERSIAADGDYNAFSVAKHSRYALVNQGFDVYAVTPDAPLADSLNIVVVADPVSEYSEAQMANLRAYLDRGGNMLLLCDYGNQAAVRPLLEAVGLNCSDRQLAVREGELSADLVLSRGESMLVSMPGCLALDTLPDSKGFVHTPLLKTIDSAWLENDWDGFRDDAVECDGDETQAAYVTGWLASREVGGRSQKVIALGDADCFGNAELSIYREGVTTDNFDFINDCFRILSDGQFPLSVERVPALDTRMKIGVEGADIVRILFLYLLPALILACGVFVLLRRRRA